jgi:diaminopimelate epimerase
MGAPLLNWKDIPLSREEDTLNMPALLEGLGAPVAVSMGNPHAVFFVDDINLVNLENLGPGVENNPLFPQRTNVEFAQILCANQIRMRVWERGAGITSACGSGACATLVAAVRAGLSAEKADIIMEGGVLTVEWKSRGDVFMTGPVNTAFKGEAYLEGGI